MDGGIASLGKGAGMLQMLNPLSAPPATRWIAFVLPALYILSWATRWLGDPVSFALGLVPGRTITSFFLWNIFTAGFWHSSLVDMIGNVAVHLMAGKYLETIWGSKEFLKFICIINAASGAASFFVLLFLFFTTGDENDWFPDVPYGGFGGVVCAYAVALKQLVPDIEMPLLGGIGGMSVRYKHLPIMFLGTGLFFHFLRVPSTYVMLTVFGFLFSWIYLRFYQTRDGFTGDSSDQFSFTSFLPPLVQPYAAPFFNVLSKILCLCVPTRRDSAQQQQQPSRIVDLSKYSGFSVLDQPADAERRRQVGLKALDARMANIKSSPAPKSSVSVSSVLNTQPGRTIQGITTSASIDVSYPAGDAV